jgi:hypothetical protein
MENQFSEKESLELINQMINSAKNNLQKGMGNIFLLWGYLVAGISLAIFILLLVLPEPAKYNGYILWCLMAIGGPAHMRLIRKMEQQQMVKTYVDKILSFVWTGFAVSIVLMILGVISSLLVIPSFTETSHEFLRWFQWLFITPFMLSLYGFALFISGKAYGYQPLATGGIICWVASTLLLISIHHPYTLEIQQITLSISAICGYVIPGHLLNKKEKSHV